MKDSKPNLYSTDAVAEAVTTYSERQSLDLPQWLLDYHAEIVKNNSNSNLMISTYQARALVWLARLMDAQRVLEIGVYLGFSSMVWSHAVGLTGKVTGLEFSPDYASRSKAAFRANSLSNITLHVGDGLQTLPALDPAEPYDVVFIDAQKSGYPAYLRAVLELSPPGGSRRLLRRGGLIIGDNALRKGLVADDSEANPYRSAAAAEEKEEGEEYRGQRSDVGKVREFNDAVKASARLEAFLLPLWDGLNLARLVD
ncbi:O-methyltransferase [Truncatella angustata]|uniref:O-methyltransferase n=1 Tax=Truncatella angustata TaxID=152316 RepID=A0A9P8ZYC5_9PEZI|nr:O-methyltransferase [Truncatella angustata]KAH6655896.1 O-methyltransferase [Truncatella angustata]